MPLLDWLNKDQAVKQANQVPYRLLQSVPELSYGDSNSENMLIQGDILDPSARSSTVLKSPMSARRR